MATRITRDVQRKRDFDVLMMMIKTGGNILASLIIFMSNTSTLLVIFISNI